ncbi:MAG: DNA repair protein RecN [bacterium]
MLKKLSIRHFAIIDTLDLEFEEGLNILSGETGAGKSIILQALGLLLGGRGYSDLIRSGEEECEVAAEFDVSTQSEIPSRVSKTVSSSDRSLKIRRILNRSGKGKVWVNEQASTVGELQELGEFLMDLVSQHESQNLLSEDMPRSYLDGFGGHETLLQTYREVYERYLSLSHELKTLEAKAKEAREKEDLYRFQLREIAEANLKPQEEEELLQERKILSHASKISETVNAVEGLLYSANDSVTELLGKAGSALSRISGIDPDLDREAEQIKSRALELEEISRFFQSYLNRVDFDPDRLTQLENRLDTLAGLKKKYGGSVEAVLEKAEELEKMIGLIDRFDESAEALKKQFQEIEKDLTLKAQKLTQARKKAGGELARAMEKELASLAMAKTRFEVRVRQRLEEAAFSPTGVDEIQFYIAPNVGEEPKPLNLIASGGELSRILLALKGVLRSPDSALTYVFDEVDTGIGGAVAEVVGQKLKRLAEVAQVVCITHLPQIAACADAHYQIAKHEKKQRVVTEVRRLEGEEREEEIARMLAGVKITEKARLHARELMGQWKKNNSKTVGA